LGASQTPKPTFRNCKEITFNFSLYTPFFLNGCKAFSTGIVSNMLTFASVNALWLFFCLNLIQLEKINYLNPL
jgi:hypothetical protein